MGDPEATSAEVKTAIERALVSDIVRSPEYAMMGFSRIFNREGDSFSRIFSRGGTGLENLKMQELTTLDDEAFKRFTERVQVLQEMGLSGSPEAR
jgi:hypothetical protein